MRSFSVNESFPKFFYSCFPPFPHSALLMRLHRCTERLRIHFAHRAARKGLQQRVYPLLGQTLLTFLPPALGTLWVMLARGSSSSIHCLGSLRNHHLLSSSFLEISESQRWFCRIPNHLGGSEQGICQNNSLGSSVVTAIWTDTAELSPGNEMRDKVKGRGGNGAEKGLGKTDGFH